MEWKQLTDYPEYELSNTGLIRRFGRIRKGYNGVYKLSVNNKIKSVRITNLMRTHWRYEWIKELDDDEMVRPIVNHPGYYITSKGRVWSDYYYRWLKSTLWKEDRYYYNVRIGDKNHYIHTLVGRHFLEGYEDGLYVCHTDEELPFPQINYVDNLWLGTQMENIRDAKLKGRIH